MPIYYDVCQVIVFPNVIVNNVQISIAVGQHSLNIS